MTDYSLTYSSALYSLAVDEHMEAETYDELRQIADILRTNPEFVKLLDSPAVAPQERLDMVDEVFANAQQYIKNFLKLLTENRSVYCFDKCVQQFSNMYEKAYNIERVTAVTATALDDELIGVLKDKLIKLTGKNIVLDNEVKPEIIGGILLRFENREIDGSVKTRIAEIEKAIKL